MPAELYRPAARASRRCGKILKRPNSMLASASDMSIARRTMVGITYAVPIIHNG